MTWEVEYADEFKECRDTLDEKQQDKLAASVKVLQQKGPALDYPHSSKVYNSRFANMRELRTQAGGHPLRTLLAFDPRRCAILLIGGDKTGIDNWYEICISIADALFDVHLKEIAEQGSDG